MSNKSRLITCIVFITIKITSQPLNFIDPRNIDIVRDSFGVPHIYAKTDAEMAYGLAWAHSEDDFKHIQEFFLPVKGKMGKVMGKNGAAGDYAFQLFRCKEVTQEKWKTLSNNFLKLVDGYVQGYNAYARSHQKELLDKSLIKITPEEYVAMTVFALTIFNGGDDALINLFNNTTFVAPQIQTKGSNSIAIHKDKTDSGENFLLINAHQPNSGTQAFYEAHLNSEEGMNIIGGVLPGGLCILHGVNEYLGWAHTVNHCDRLDIFQLEMNPHNKNQYKFDDKWLDLEKKTVRLQIKNIPLRIKKQIFWSRYGATMKNKQGVFSIRLGANQKIGALDQWYQMNKAKNFTEFYKALSMQELSMFNIMYADVNDTIFYINNALIPIRDSLNNYDWKKTLPGNTSTTLWNDFRKINELPQYVNPSAGFLYNTNHSPFLVTDSSCQLNPANFPKVDGWESHHVNRSVRFLELFPKNELVSFKKFKEIKYDKSLPTKLHFFHGYNSLFTIDENKYVEFKEIILTLKNWDKNSDEKSKGAAVFLLVNRHVEEHVLIRESREITQEESLEALLYVKNYFNNYFNGSIPELGQVQKIVRGKKEYTSWGLPDVLSPQYTKLYKPGVFKIGGGDAYILFAKFRKGSLPYIESINTFGSSSIEGSKHFNDQLPIFQRQGTKKMTLNKTDIYINAEKIYNPIFLK